MKHHLINLNNFCLIKFIKLTSKKRKFFKSKPLVGLIKFEENLQFY
ncbi:hypothetical protein A1OE_794 [Candidatus Endolissoclinum faulkneri L2]|uniref:Uncharacterized protein n=1 Tax=Candidatus Endolissoclinum faulkneri L2 TaxID=1193729 RepID=K7YR35_9PROT|nr:hypothetical protein A1OE_794 [Candidatus Endolissoclinum faulkneri L2]